MRKHPILLVDDDALVINALAKKFATNEIEFYTAKTPEEAKVILDKVVPEVLILDLLLTKEDGSAGILDKLKSDTRLNNVPVVVLTNLDKPELKDMLLSAGAVREYLVKGSLSLDDLYEKIFSYLEPKKQG